MPQKLAHIDALRGVAILMVIFDHVSQTFPHLPNWLFQSTKYGQLGVQLLFVVSSITLCISADQRSSENAKTKKYLLRRFFRIAPLYYFGILWYFLFRSIQISLNAGGLHLARVQGLLYLTNIFFLHGIFPSASNSVVPGGWSIGTEMAFYVCFPLLFLLFGMLSKQSTLRFLGTFVILLAGYYVLEYFLTTLLKMPVERNNVIYGNLLNQLPVFALGIFSYFLAKEHGFAKLPLPLNLFLLILFGWLTYFLWVTDLRPVAAFMFVPFTAAAAFVFVYNIFAAYRFLSFPVFQKIGLVSYSMYLFHFMFAWYGVQYFYEHSGFIGKIHGISRPATLFSIAFLGTVIFTYLIAFISERYIEKPGIELGRKIIQKIP